MRKRTALFLIICLSTAFILTACSSTDSEPVETEESRDLEGPETDGYGISTMPLYIRYTVEDITDDVATFLIENCSGYEISYDLYFDLEAEKDDEWVLLERLEDVAFEDTEYTLADQSEAEIKCDLAPYGKLPDGNYRILKDDIYVEFTIENGQLAVAPGFGYSRIMGGLREFQRVL